jgi:hypothetical protein
MSYYDVDSILTDAQVKLTRRAALALESVFPLRDGFTTPAANTRCTQKLPCTFELEVPGLGILEGNPGEDVRSLAARHCVPLLTQSRLNRGHASIFHYGWVRCFPSGEIVPRRTFYPNTESKPVL